MKTPVDFSVVVPILNEQATIVKLLSQIHRVVDLVGGQWEVIYVNDGSWDQSLEVLLNARATYPFLRIVDLSRNFGHQAALTAGMSVEYFDQRKSRVNSTLAAALGPALAAPYLIQGEGQRPRTRYGLRLAAGAIRFGDGRPG